VVFGAYDSYPIFPPFLFHHSSPIRERPKALKPTKFSYYHLISALAFHIKVESGWNNEVKASLKLRE